MEELSIEEKAKRYDEAIEIAKDCQYTKSIFVSDFNKIPTEVEFIFKRK